MGSSFLLRLLEEAAKRREGVPNSPIQEEENNPLSMETGLRQETNPSLLQDLQEQPEAMATYRQHIEQTPRSENYRPGVSGRVLAGLAGGLDAFGGSGSDTATEMLEAPYQRALAEHKYKGEGLRQSAELGVKEEGNDIKARRVENQMQAETMRYNAKLAELEMRKNAGEDERTIQREKMAETIRHQTATEGIQRMTAGAAVSRANTFAQTAPMQAQAAQTRAGASMINAETYKATGGRANTKPISPQSQDYAKNMAVEDMMEKPEYQLFVEEEDGEQVIIRSKMPPDVKKKFDQEVKDRAKQILNNRHGNIQ